MSKYDSVGPKSIRRNDLQLKELPSRSLYCTAPHFKLLIGLTGTACGCGRSVPCPEVWYTYSVEDRFSFCSPNQYNRHPQRNIPRVFSHFDIVWQKNDCSIVALLTGPLNAVGAAYIFKMLDGLFMLLTLSTIMAIA